MKIPSLFLGAVTSLCLCSLACGHKGEFDTERAKDILEAGPVALDGEQVSLTDMQLKCGVDSELWDMPVEVSQGRSTAHLNAKGKELNFGDDPVIEPTFHPYVQIRGSFMLQVDDVSGLRDGEEKGTKVVDAKAGIKVQNPCFPNALPIMGVKHGNFRQDTPPSFAFSFSQDGWHLDKLLH